MNSVKRARSLKTIFNSNNIKFRNGVNNNFNGGNRLFSRCDVLNDNGSSDFIIKSCLPDPVVPDVTFLERLWKNSSNYKDHVAIECAETKKKYTYTELWAHMARFATSLRTRLGVSTGDVIAVMLPNCPEYPIVTFGGIQAGASITTINPIYKEYEIIHQLQVTKPKIIITVKECYKTVIKALSKLKATTNIVIVDKPNELIPDYTIRFSEIADTGPIDYKLLEKIETTKDSVAFIPFSSGTTGLPKGVEISIFNAMATVDMMQHDRVCLPKDTLGDFQEVVPCVLPFFHIYGLVVAMMGHMSKGCKLVTLSKFSTSLYLDVLKNYKATLLYVVPPIAVLLAKHPDVKKEHLQHVSHLLSGAAPLSSSDLEPLIEKSNGNIKFCQGYGATETTAITTMTLPDSNPDCSSAGVPLGGIEIMFADLTTGQPVPIGSEGELLVRGPNVMKGYYKNEKATLDSLTEDGFYKTGDCGFYKPGVGVYITDRIKELIKVKGMQVAPAELESLLRSHPAVQDAAVIGVPHEISGEVPKAFVITKDGQKVNEAELQDFVAKQVAVFKKIEEVQFVREIPKTASGKILRKDLKKMYA